MALLEKKIGIFFFLLLKNNTSAQQQQHSSRLLVKIVELRVDHIITHTRMRALFRFMLLKFCDIKCHYWPPDNCHLHHS